MENNVHFNQNKKDSRKNPIEALLSRTETENGSSLASLDFYSASTFATDERRTHTFVYKSPTNFSCKRPSPITRLVVKCTCRLKYTSSKNTYYQTQLSIVHFRNKKEKTNSAFLSHCRFTIEVFAPVTLQRELAIPTYRLW